MKEFAVPFVLVTLPIWTYLLVAKHIGVVGLSGLLLASTLAGVLMYNAEKLTDFTARWKDFEFIAKVRDEVFAKAEEVRRMGEDIAAAISYALTGMGRFAPDDLDAQLGSQREHLMEMLRKIGTDTKRVDEVIQPLTKTISNDLAGEVVGAAVKALQEKLGRARRRSKSTPSTRRLVS
jgi:hypothetical protein